MEPQFGGSGSSASGSAGAQGPGGGAGSSGSTTAPLPGAEAALGAAAAAAPLTGADAVFGPGAELLRWEGDETVFEPAGAAVAARRHLLLYFSAGWCAPCKDFTPKLAAWYFAHRATAEVVFVSSDKSNEAFAEYFANHPWPALPYEARDKKAELGRRYNVRSIPTLLVLDAASGALLTDMGVQGLLSAPGGCPWAHLGVAQASADF